MSCLLIILAHCKNSPTFFLPSLHSPQPFSLLPLPPSGANTPFADRADRGSARSRRPAREVVGGALLLNAVAMIGYSLSPN
eukprot:144205-Rhodomonas_salina.1